MTEASVHVNLTLLSQAFRRKTKPELVTLYHGVLDRAGITDQQLDTATVQILENEKLFPVPAVVLAYCRGEAKGVRDAGFLYGTQIRTADFVRDHNAYAEELCARDGFWKDADERRRYEQAAKLMPRSEHPIPITEYLKAIAEVAESMKPKQESDANPKRQPSDSRRPHREPRKKSRERPDVPF